MKVAPILLASTNPAKQAKLRWLLEGIPLAPHTPAEVGLTNLFAPSEPGKTHEENASLKALSWSRTASMLTLSSDGGLVVPTLGAQWDSVLTHRLAGEGYDDERVRHLLELMRPYSGEQRRVSWVEALAIAEAGRVLASWRVEGASGYLTESAGPQPSVPGFWAFTIWYLPQVGKRYIDLSDEELALVDDHWTQLKSLVHRFFSQPQS